jgi:hypothetical protein
MAKQLLQEYFELCPEGRCPVDVLTESEKARASSGTVYLVGVCQKAGVKNGNGRIYRHATLQREVDAYQRSIEERRSLGELDHPESSVINLKNASHLVNKLYFRGNDVIGKIEVLDTPSGNILKALVQSGVKLGISSRGLGTVKEQNGQTMVEDDFQLICFDIVSEPSTPGAYLTTGASTVSVAAGPGMNESRMNRGQKINDIIKDILKD